MRIKNFNYSISKFTDLHSSEKIKSHLSYNFHGVDFEKSFDNDLLALTHKNTEKISDNLIPPGLKYIDKNYLVYERPPTYKLINFYPVYLDQIVDSISPVSYYLPLPWQLYVVHFDNSYRTYSVRMFFMNSPLQSEDQILYLPYIPNFYTNANLCRPFFSTLNDIERYTKDISGVIQSSYDWVWFSNFNLDLTETVSSIYTQKTPLEVSRGITSPSYSNYRIPFQIVDETYKIIEKFSLKDVCSFIWPNPSFNQHYSVDDENLDYDYYFEQYCLANNLSLDPEYYEDDESGYYSYDHFYESVLESSDFRNFIPKSYNKPKTYSEIINFIKLNTLSEFSVGPYYYLENILSKAVNENLDSSDESEPF